MSTEILFFHVQVFQSFKMIIKNEKRKVLLKDDKMIERMKALAEANTSL